MDVVRASRCNRDRIASALERIATALERLAPERPTMPSPGSTSADPEVVRAWFLAGAKVRKVRWSPGVWIRVDREREGSLDHNGDFSSVAFSDWLDGAAWEVVP